MPATLPAPLQIRALGAMTCGLLSAFLALFYVAARTGFGVSVSAVAGVLGLAWCVISIPMTVHDFLATRGGSLRWYQREGFWTVVLIVVTAIAGQVNLSGGRLAGAFLFTAGLIPFSWTVFRALQGMRTRFAVLTIFGVLGYAVWVAGVEWANGYLNPLFVESLILRGGDGHVDTLFLTSLGNMLNTYGVSSTGWDGVPYTAYHFGSAWLFGHWSTLTGMTVLDFYQVGAPVVLVPLFLRSLLVLAAEIREGFFAEPTQPPSAVFTVLMAVIACGTIGFLPPSALQAAAVWDAGPFLSESYVLALALALLAFSLIASFGSAWTNREQSQATQSRWGTGLFVLVFLPLVGGAIGATKVSIVVLTLTAGLYLILRLQLYRVRLFLAGAAAVVTVSLYVYSIVAWSGLSQGIEPLSFMRLVVAQTWWPFFFVLHLFWTWLYVYLRLKQESAETLADVAALFRTRRIIDVELALVFGVVGLLPGMIFNLRGDAYYFSDVQRWFSLSLLLANPSLLLRLWVGKRQAGEPQLRGRSFRDVRLNRFVAGTVGVLAACTLLLTVTGWGTTLIHRNFATRRALQEIAGTRPTNSLANEVIHLLTHPAAWFNGGVQALVSSQIKPLADSTAFAQALQSRKRHAIVSALLAVGRLPVEERRASLIHIDPGLEVYWQFLAAPGACQFSVMIGPALSATALLDGVPAGCQLDGFYGTETYREKPASSAPPRIGEAALCTRAKRLGFSRVIEMQPAEGNRVRVVRLACGV